MATSRFSLLVLLFVIPQGSASAVAVACSLRPKTVVISTEAAQALVSSAAEKPASPPTLLLGQCFCQFLSSPQSQKPLPDNNILLSL
jgi:hypothetical protein